MNDQEPRQADAQTGENVEAAEPPARGHEGYVDPAPPPDQPATADTEPPAGQRFPASSPTDPQPWNPERDPDQPVADPSDNQPDADTEERNLFQRVGEDLDAGRITPRAALLGLFRMFASGANTDEEADACFYPDEHPDDA